MNSQLPNNVPQNIKNAINDFVLQVNKNFGNSIKIIYLYGSYARGDFRNDSDIDIMILTDFTDEEILENRDKIYELAYDIEEKYSFDIWISPLVKNIDKFKEKLEYSFFYENVKKDGIVI